MLSVALLVCAAVVGVVPQVQPSGGASGGASVGLGAEPTKKPEQAPAYQPVYAERGADGITPLPGVVTRGTGPVQVVFIPGLNCDSLMFLDWAERNKERYTMHVVTLPGFGGTPAPRPGAAGGAGGERGAYLDNAAKAVWKWVEEKKIERPVLMGHSMGGHLAMRLGAEHGEKVRAVVSIDGVPYFPSPPGETAEARETRVEGLVARVSGMTQTEYEWMQVRNAQQWLSDPERMEQLAKEWSLVPAATSARYLGDLLRADVREKLAGCTAPLLLVASSAPGVSETKMEEARETFRALLAKAPKAKVAMFRDSRHFVHEERPEELAGVVAAFLAGEEVREPGPKPPAPPKPRRPREAPVLKPPAEEGKPEAVEPPPAQPGTATPEGAKPGGG
jgi:pimeloyl-ACP methyl ester carboxylesterase